MNQFRFKSALGSKAKKFPLSFELIAFLESGCLLGNDSGAGFLVELRIDLIKGFINYRPRNIFLVEHYLQLDFPPAVESKLITDIKTGIPGIIQEFFTGQYLDDLFTEFNDGYIEADASLKKVTFMKLEYIKRAKPYPDETAELYELVVSLLNHVENYFIYYKKSN